MAWVALLCVAMARSCQRPPTAGAIKTFTLAPRFPPPRSVTSSSCFTRLTIRARSLFSASDEMTAFAKLRYFQRDPYEARNPPTSTFTAAIRNGRFTSIVFEDSEFERPREFRFSARRVISTDSPNGRAYGRVARGKTDRSAEPLRKTPSRLPAVL